jgi:hypothetical protein
LAEELAERGEAPLIWVQRSDGEPELVVTDDRDLLRSFQQLRTGDPDGVLRFAHKYGHPPLCAAHSRPLGHYSPTPGYGVLPAAEQKRCVDESTVQPLAVYQRYAATVHSALTLAGALWRQREGRDNWPRITRETRVRRTAKGFRTSLRIRTNHLAHTKGCL